TGREFQPIAVIDSDSLDVSDVLCRIIPIYMLGKPRRFLAAVATSNGDDIKINVTGGLVRCNSIRRNKQAELGDLLVLPLREGIELAAKRQGGVGERRAESKRDISLALGFGIELRDHETLTVSKTGFVVQLYLDFVPAWLAILLIGVEAKQI